MRHGLMLALTGLVLVAGCATTPTDGGGDDAGAAALRVGTSATAAPLAFKEGGRLAGAEVDFAKAMGDALGRPVKVRNMAFDQLIPALERGEIDIIMAGMSVTGERARRVAFTEPYLRTGQIAAVAAGRAGEYVMVRAIVLRAKSVACERGTTAELIAREQMRHATCRTYASLDAAASAVARGEADVLLGDGPSVLWMVRQRPGELAVPDYSPLTEESLAWAVRREDTALREQVNTVLATWQRDQTLQRVLDKWAARLQ